MIVIIRKIRMDALFEHCANLVALGLSPSLDAFAARESVVIGPALLVRRPAQTPDLLQLVEVRRPR
jgi:hypothetical protein